MHSKVIRSRPAPPLVALLAAGALVLAACAEDRPAADPPSPPEGEPTETAEAPEPEPPGDFSEAEPEVIASGLEVPWGIAFLGEDILLTERPGRVRLVHAGELLDEPVLELDVGGGEGGLLGIALDSRYPDRPFVYLYFTTPDGSENRIERFRIAGEGSDLSLSRDSVLVTGIRAAGNHNGGRIAFGPDGLLYVTTGDAGQPGFSSDRSSLAGKILRFEPTGEASGGNPFNNALWAYGVRNPQGLAWDDDGNLYASEHGPSGEFGLCCLDELNLIEPGGFYGWPYRAGNQEAGSPDEFGDMPDVARAPLAHSGPDGTWAPGGIAYVEHAGGGAIYVATLRGESLIRFDIGDAPDEVIGESVVLDDLGRLRDVVLGPDDCLFLLTSNRDGRGTPAEDDDRLLRLCA